MKSNQVKYFEDCLDTILMVDKPVRENQGEDSFYCAKSNRSAIVSVYDGCGGLGARKYDSFKGHTGAYIASRIVSGAVHDWYHNNWKHSWKTGKKLTASISEYIKKAYEVCDPYGIEKMKIRGSMVRKFPTTLALAYAEQDNDGMLVHVLWAGDSRVYLLDENGLAQLTKDDTDIEDALENLSCDGAMTNVLSADGNYEINHKTIRISEPTIVFAATDGCFAYLQSPMEFEYIILDALVNEETPANFKKELYKQFSNYAGDDFAFGMMSFYYGSYENTKNAFTQRYEHVQNKYINIIDQEQNYECIERLWQKYKPEYERYLR